jgi:hypothetical protein
VVGRDVDLYGPTRSPTRGAAATPSSAGARRRSPRGPHPSSPPAGSLFSGWALGGGETCWALHGPCGLWRILFRRRSGLFLFGGCSASPPGEISKIDTQFDAPVSFDTQFDASLKFDTAHSNFFEMRDSRNFLLFPLFSRSSIPNLSCAETELPLALSTSSARVLSCYFFSPAHALFFLRCDRFFYEP